MKLKQSRYQLLYQIQLKCSKYNSQEWAELLNQTFRFADRHN